MTDLKLFHHNNKENIEHRFILPFITMMYERNPRYGWKSIIFGVIWWYWDCGIEFTWNLKDD